MALILAADLVSAETWNRPVYELTGNTITVAGNINYPSVYGDNWNEVYATANGTVTVTGNGTISAPGDWDSFGSLTFENASNIILESGVTFRHFLLDISSRCDSATLKGTYQGCDIFLDGVVDLTNAKLQASSERACQLELACGTTHKVSNLLVSAGTTMIMVYEKNSPSAANPVLQGNLVLNGKLPSFSGSTLTDEGCGIVFMHSEQYTSLYSTLVITGSLTISGYTPIEFYNEEYGMYLPDPSADIIVCGSVQESQLGYLKPYTAYATMDDDVMTAYNGHFTAQGGSDGKVHIRLVSGPGPEPGPGPGPEPTPIPEGSIVVEAGQTVVLGASEETTPSASKPVYMNGGTADATKLADALLNNAVFIGKGGTVLTKSGQHATLAGTDTVQYSLQGQGSARGGNLALGTAGGDKSNIQLKGTMYKVGAATVQNGLATVSSGSTLDATSTTVNAGGSITNFGNIHGNVELAANGATMLNQGVVHNNVTLQKGSTLINNGSINGDTLINSGAAVYGSGLFTDTHAKTGATLHIGNSPGYQHHDHLTLEKGASLYFCVDGLRRASLADNGAGTYSHLAADSLTLNGGLDINVEVGINFITAVLVSRTATLKIANFGTVDGTTPLDGKAFTYTITDTTGLLESAFLTTNGKGISFSGTVGDKALAALAGSQGTQVANTMWASGNLLNDFADLAETRLAGKLEKGGTAAWAAGLGSFQRETEQAAGYTYNGGGYALGIQHAFLDEFKVGVAFGQSFGHFEAKDNSLKARQRGVMPALTARYQAGGDSAYRPVVSAHVAYGDMKYKADTYGLLPGHAEWTDKTLSAGITAGAEIKVTENTTVTPFIGLSYVAVDQKASTEDMGIISRRYSGGKMHNLSIPVGATLRSNMGAFTPEVTLVYKADVDRDNPEVQSDCMGFKSTAQGAKPGRHALYMNLGGTYAVTENVGIFASYTFNFREHATNHSVNAGVQVSF